MQFFISQKSLGKRKLSEASVYNQPIHLDITTSHIKAQDLLVKLATQQVNDFNGLIEQQKQALRSTHPLASTSTGPNALSNALSHSMQAIKAASLNPIAAPAPALSQQTIDTYLVNLGKVDFANIANLNKVSLEDGITNTLQAFEDGLFIMFVDDIEVNDLEQTLSVFEGCTISLIRLTFLAGGWF